MTNISDYKIITKDGLEEFNVKYKKDKNISQQIEDTDGFIEWFVAANKKDDTMEDIMRGATYAGLLSNMVHCTLSDTVFNKKIWGNEKASDEDIKSLAKTMADFMDSL